MFVGCASARAVGMRVRLLSLVAEVGMSFGPNGDLSDLGPRGRRFAQHAIGAVPTTLRKLLVTDFFF